MMNYNICFENKIAVVTGAAGGIGAQIAKGLLENKADLAMLDCNAEALETLVAELKNAYPERKIIGIICDVTKRESIAEATEKIKESFGTVDILINNAGTGSNIRSVNETPESWSRVIDLNLNATFFVSQAIASSFMIPKKSGKIVNMSSLSAFLGIPNSVSYSSSKGAVLQMTKSLAAEWARFNINVNCVCPGFVDTPLISVKRNDEKWLSYVLSHNPMRRLAQPEDVVGPTLFLASNLSDYVTGTSIIVDGGYSCSG